MIRSQQPALTFFAVGIVGLGILALHYGDFAMVWQPVAPWVPGRTLLAYVSGVLMLACGTGLLFRAIVAWSVRILFPYLIVWALLKVPALVVAPRIEAVWLGFGELTVLLAGGWTLFAMLGELRALPGHRQNPLLRFATGQSGVRAARLLFAVSLLPIGLSHILYLKETAALVPAWLPYPIGWAYATGAGQMACGIGLLFASFTRSARIARVAAVTEAGMLSLFALLVWIPAIAGAPGSRLPWTAFFISWAIAAAAWVVAANTSAKEGGILPV